MNRGCIVLAGALYAEMAGVRRLGRFRKAGALKFGADHISYYTGGIHGKDVALFVSGVGGAKAYGTAKAACAALPVRAYVSVGFSAALKPELRPGDVVVGVRAAHVDDQDACFESDRALLQTAMGALLGYGTCLFGPLLAADRVLTTSMEKRAVAGSALALDMESLGAAKAASEAGVPFLAIRVISDTLDEDLPVDFNRFMKGGGMDWPRFFLHVVTHPGVIPGLMRLGRNSRLAAHNLAGAVDRFLLKLT